MILRCSRTRTALCQWTDVHVLKLSWKAAAYKRFYTSHITLAEPYPYLPIEAYDGNVGNNVKLKRLRSSLLHRTNSTNSEIGSMNQTTWVSVFSLEKVCFCYVYDYSWGMECKGPISFRQCKRASRSIQNGSMETVPERFCSVNGL